MFRLLVTLAWLIFPSGENPPGALVGQWESAVRTPGGIGNILEFRPNGTMTQISAAMGEADYKLEGEWLRAFWKDPATGKVSEVDTRLEFEGDSRFLEKGEDGSGDTWSERVGEPVRGGSPLLGQWCSLYLETLPAYRAFTPDRMFNRLPMQVLRGRYAIAGDTLTVEISGQPPGQYPFRFENGLLVIKSRDGSEKKYKRPETALLKGF
ncbi:MAG TPA: hypothetical protein VGL03_10185 [Thermoanaerobaculia bacterium]|jgi:hypothetical protein